MVCIMVIYAQLKCSLVGSSGISSFLEQLSHRFGLYHLKSVFPTSFSLRASWQDLKSHLKTNRRIHPHWQPSVSKECSRGLC